MKRILSRVDPGVALLVVLAIVSVGLSAVALTSRPATAARATDPLGSFTAGPASLPAAASSTTSPAPHRSSTTPRSSVPTTTDSTGASTVVVLGDANSVGDPSTTWVGLAEKQLAWGTVVNLSAPGRGYVQAPRSCDASPCANFDGSIAAVVAAHPDLVITFGGTADGNYDLSPAATKYFADLRRALPSARLVAVSPVTTLSPVPYYFTMHDQTISAAVAKVGGTFVDVGQPGSGDGASLSSQAQADIAAKIVAALS